MTDRHDFPMPGGKPVWPNDPRRGKPGGGHPPLKPGKGKGGRPPLFPGRTGGR